MKLSDFDYPLHPGQVAQHPAAERDGARLMVMHREPDWIEHKLFRDIAVYLRSGDVMVLNDTRVIPARLYGEKPSGGRVEILMLHEIRQNTWRALVRGMREGKVLVGQGITASVSRHDGEAVVSFEGQISRNGRNGDIKDRLQEIGTMPLPPYIKRHAGQQDTERYQTVYAGKTGAVAAPTAGLHFTVDLLAAIREKGVEIRMLTLHVGYGTFGPVVCQDVEGHRMQEEFYEIPEGTALAVNSAKSDGRRVVAVGTTVTRALEASAFDVSARASLPEGRGCRVRAGSGKASIFIYPGHTFRVVDVLVTNFHLPKSTPLMLTSAFSGLSRLKAAYGSAAEAGYRFFSYGDAMLIV